MTIFSGFFIQFLFILVAILFIYLSGHTFTYHSSVLLILPEISKKGDIIKMHGQNGNHVCLEDIIYVHPIILKLGVQELHLMDKTNLKYDRSRVAHIIFESHLILFHLLIC